MKRRDFLKILGVAPAIVAVPALAKADKPDLYMFGESTTELEYNGNHLKAAIKHISDDMDKDTLKALKEARNILNNHPNPSEAAFGMKKGDIAAVEGMEGFFVID